MSDQMIFLVIVSGCFWLGVWLDSIFYWIVLILFGIMIDWPQSIPKASMAISRSDDWWLFGCNVLMFFVVGLLEDLLTLWRKRHLRLAGGLTKPGSQQRKTGQSTGTIGPPQT